MAAIWPCTSETTSETTGSKIVDLRTEPESLNLPRRTLLFGSSASPGTVMLARFYNGGKELTGNDELLVCVTFEGFLGDEIESFHRVFHDLLIPLVI